MTAGAAGSSPERRPPERRVAWPASPRSGAFCSGFDCLVTSASAVAVTTDVQPAVARPFARSPVRPPVRPLAPDGEKQCGAAAVSSGSPPPPSPAGLPASRSPQLRRPAALKIVVAAVARVLTIPRRGAERGRALAERWPSTTISACSRLAQIPLTYGRLLFTRGVSRHCFRSIEQPFEMVRACQRRCGPGVGCGPRFGGDDLVPPASDVVIFAWTLYAFATSGWETSLLCLVFCKRTQPSSKVCTRT